MYKVFLRDNVICFISPELAQEHLDTNFCDPDFNKIQEILSTIDQDTQHTDFYFVTTDPEKLFIDFYSRMRKMAAAGGVIVNELNQFLFIFRRGKWDLPKGKIDGEETEEQAAIREVQEETGVQQVAISSRLNSSYHVYSIGSEWILKETHWFVMKANSQEKVFPQAEEGITEVRWVKPEDLKKMSEQVYRSLKSVVVESAARVLQKTI